MSRRPAHAAVFALCCIGACTSPPSRPPPSPPAVRVPAVKAAHVDDDGLGQLDFAITGNATCQREFKIGMLAMHSFQYPLAAERFETALAADSGCAMAAWGLAMSYVHPVWREIDR